jgi:hypothetical protein
MELSDERFNEIRTEYYDLKLKMRDAIRIVAVEYFTKSCHPYSDIEKTIGNILKWANNDWESPEERSPQDMIAKNIMVGVLLEIVLVEMIRNQITTIEWVATNLPKYEIKVQTEINKKLGVL